MKRFFALIFILIQFAGFSQTKQDYIYNYAEIAVKEMESARIPASITLAQGILESRFGTSDLSTLSNNHFGIKCHKGWNGLSVKHDDDAKDECFRKYSSAIDSFRDHSEFLSKRGRYSDLFKLSIYAYKGWAKGLKKAGYATNPKYADHLIKIIEEERLYVFDRMQSYEVRPYIASLQNKVQPNVIFAIETEQNQVDDQIIKIKPFKAVVEVQGGPAAAPEIVVAQSRDIFIENDIKTIFAFTDDKPVDLAVLYDIPLDRLYKYNEWPKYLNEFSAGMKVYLQPKRNKSRNIAQLYHRVAPGETMYQIGQLYGIKTDKLYKWNVMNEHLGEQPRAGEMISLRKKVMNKPLLRKTGDVFKAEQMVQQGQDNAIQTHDAESQTTNNTIVQPTIINKETEVITEKSQPAPSIKEENNEVDIWESYPSTTTSTEVETISEENNQTSGRSIIYEPTPPVNQTPVKAYKEKAPVYTQPSPVTTPQDVQPTEIKTLAKYHTVIKGDTLYRLSKKYGVTVSQIKSWNNLPNTTISIGQKLIVGK